MEREEKGRVDAHIPYIRGVHMQAVLRASAKTHARAFTLNAFGESLSLASNLSDAVCEDSSNFSALACHYYE